MKAYLSVKTNIMGVLTDIFIASPEEAEKLGLSEDTFEDFKGIFAKGQSTVTLESLHEIIAAKDGTKAEDISMIFSADEEGPWVLEIPIGLSRSLAALKGQDLSEISAKWSRTEEMQMDYDPDSVGDLLREMVDLADEAVKLNKGLLMWMSL